MANDSYRLVGFNCQVEIAENCQFTRGISEPNVLEFDTTMGNVCLTWLFGVNLGGLFNNAKYKLSCLASFSDRWQLRQRYTCADRSYKDNITACIDLLRVKIKSFRENCSNVEDQSDKDKSNSLRVSKE